jgi:hypothetical protein
MMIKPARMANASLSYALKTSIFTMVTVSQIPSIIAVNTIINAQTKSMAGRMVNVQMDNVLLQNAPAITIYITIHANRIAKNIAVNTTRIAATA